MKDIGFKSSTLVCVTDQKKCESLITAGRKIADRTKTNLYVINVNNYDQYGKKQDPVALEYLYNISKENGAAMNVIYDEDFLEVIKNSVNKYNGVNIVTGMPINENSVLTTLWKKIDTLDYYMVNEIGKIVKVGSAQSVKVHYAKR